MNLFYRPRKVKLFVAFTLSVRVIVAFTLSVRVMQRSVLVGIR
jgi:hypothetical protein